MTENEVITVLKMIEAHGSLPNKAKEMSIEALKEIQAYRAIGTVEEFETLKEKATEYKPEGYEDRYYACKCGNILLPMWEKYPVKLMSKREGLPYCMACGQAIDWKEEE